MARSAAPNSSQRRVAADFEISVPGSVRLERLVGEADRDLLRTQGKGPVVQARRRAAFRSVGRKASDIHLQPTDDALLVRYRLDGALVTVREIPRSLAPAVLGRVKVMGRMDIAEHRLPQDGRATVR